MPHEFSVSTLRTDYLDQRSGRADGYLQRVLDGAIVYARGHVTRQGVAPARWPDPIDEVEHADLVDAVYTLAARRSLERDLSYGTLTELGDGQTFQADIGRSLPPTVMATLNAYRGPAVVGPFLA